MNGVHRTCAETAAVSRGTSDVTTKEHYQYTTSVDIKKIRAIKGDSHSLRITRDVRSECARGQRMALYKSDEFFFFFFFFSVPELSAER